MILDPEWRQANTITDWEFAAIGALLCSHYAPRDLALMIVRLQGQLEAEMMFRRGEVPTVGF